MFHFLLITFTSCIQRLKIVADFGDDVFDFIAKALNFNDDLFGLLTDLKILFNLLERIALFGPLELFSQLINAWLHGLGTIGHFDKSFVPLFVDFCAKTISLQSIWVQL